MSLLNTLGIALCLLAWATVQARAQALPDLLRPPSPSYANIQIYESFVPTGDAAQCEGRAHGEVVTAYDTWSRPLLVDTDDRPGGCKFNLAVIDPDGVLRGWNATWTFASTGGDAGQCGNQAARTVQVVRRREDISNADAVIIDTDSRPGGCEMMFHVDGRGPALLVYFAPDGDPGQCQRERDVQVIDIGMSKRIVIDADLRPGGCLLQFRIR